MITNENLHAGHSPEEGSPGSPPSPKMLVFPWDHHTNSLALYGNCKEKQNKPLHKADQPLHPITVNQIQS